mmetsp:Transcript_19726/g.33956  ORF Transcript_19726/g.33956 Transcript_19726/m.33956 type:complete len:94 (+) Transcript_19726:1277-1558(+)
MHECYATSDCKQKFGFSYKRNKIECETNMGYEAWYASYLEDQYKLAGLDSVTCTYRADIECSDALKSDGMPSLGRVGTVFALYVSVAAFLFVL